MLEKAKKKVEEKDKAVADFGRTVQKLELCVRDLWKKTGPEEKEERVKQEVEEEEPDAKKVVVGEGRAQSAVTLQGFLGHWDAAAVVDLPCDPGVLRAPDPMGWTTPFSSPRRVQSSRLLCVAPGSPQVVVVGGGGP